MKYNKLNELKEAIESYQTSYDIEEDYNTLYNLLTDYENETSDYITEDIFGLNDIITYDLAEEYAKQQLEEGGLIRLYYFLGDANLNNNLFRIDGYGNLEDVDRDDIEDIKTDVLDAIADRLDNYKGEDENEDEEA